MMLLPCGLWCKYAGMTGLGFTDTGFKIHIEQSGDREVTTQRKSNSILIQNVPGRLMWSQQGGILPVCGTCNRSLDSTIPPIIARAQNPNPQTQSSLRAGPPFKLTYSKGGPPAITSSCSGGKQHISTKMHSLRHRVIDESFISFHFNSGVSFSSFSSY